MENESKKIKLPINLGCRVSKILQEKHNIPTRKNNFGMLDFSFTEDELSLITSLELKNPVPGDLEGLHFLPNLQSLSVETRGITAHMQQKNIPSITDKDMAEISKCTSLRDLSIVNQAKATWLDVSKLENLQKLVVTHNQHLDDISGMDNLKKLWILKCFGNNRLQQIEDLDQLLIQNTELGELSLDVLLFPNAIGYNQNTGQYNLDALAQIQELAQEGIATWEEGRNGNRSIKINTNQMVQLHNKACEILADNISPTADNRDIIIGIEQYLARNVKYDYDGMEHGHTGGTNYNGLRIQDGPKGGTNGAYNALVRNTCVCEGYTRGMQYLLKLKGINSHNVDCYAGKDTTHMASNSQENQYTTYVLPDSAEYHSIICIDDYNCLYDDPCWNACYYQQGDISMPWLLKTKEEISQDHTLSFDERGVSNDGLRQPSDAIRASIQRNNLFRQSKTRTSSINDTRKTIKEQVKGQIFQREGQEI